MQCHLSAGGWHCPCVRILCSDEGRGSGLGTPWKASGGVGARRVAIFFERQGPAGVNSLASDLQLLNLSRRRGKGPRKRLLAGLPPTYSPPPASLPETGGSLLSLPAHPVILIWVAPSLPSVLSHWTHEYLCTFACVLCVEFLSLFSIAAVELRNYSLPSHPPLWSPHSHISFPC